MQREHTYLPKWWGCPVTEIFLPIPRTSHWHTYHMEPNDLLMPER